MRKQSLPHFFVNSKLISTRNLIFSSATEPPSATVSQWALFMCQPGKMPGCSQKEPISLVSHLRFTKLISPSLGRPRFYLGISMMTANHFRFPLCRNTRKLGYLAKRCSPSEP